MKTMDVKEEARRLVDSLPENSTWHDLMREISARQAGAMGLADSQAGRMTEEELLIKINEGFSETFWNRYRTLIAKRNAEKMTTKERQELIALSDEVEAKGAERLAYLTALAERRGISVRSLMAELGIHPRPVE